MKKLLPLAVLLTSAAVACPVEKGYILNGQAEMPSYLTPECGSYYKTQRDRVNKAAAGRAVWTETYKIQPGKVSRLRALVKNAWEGYRPTLDQQKGDSLVMAWMVPAPFLTVSTERVGNSIYVVFNGYK